MAIFAVIALRTASPDQLTPARSSVVHRSRGLAWVEDVEAWGEFNRSLQHLEIWRC